MRITRVAALAIALAIAGQALQSAVVVAPATAEFVGTTPCGEFPRTFLGGLPPGAACDAITWRMALTTGRADESRWNLVAVYNVPSPSNPNVTVEGPKVALQGKLDAAATAYRLTSDGTGRSLSFSRVSDGLIHLRAADDRLLVGNSGWSYTLNRADLTERPANPSQAPDLSYSISTRASGASVFGVFEGRTPCVGISRELKLAPIAGCLKVKWRVTLLQNPGTGAPTTYTIEGSLHRKQARQGAWRIVRGTATNPGAVVYQLDATATEAPLWLLQGDANVLFFLNHEQQPLTGTVDFSYTLNRVAGAQ